MAHSAYSHVPVYAPLLLMTKNGGLLPRYDRISRYPTGEEAALG
jgi:hypothetical protein